MQVEGMFVVVERLVMADAAKQALLDKGLERAAEALGDITGPVVAAFYARFPQAREAFDRLALGARHKLEAEMVEQVLYCVMNWFDRPGEIEVILLGSVQHHGDTLLVDPAWYEGLIAAAIDVLVATIPAQAADERAIWAEVARELRGLVMQAAAWVRHRSVVA